MNAQSAGGSYVAAEARMFPPLRDLLLLYKGVGRLQGSGGGGDSSVVRAPDS